MEETQDRQFVTALSRGLSVLRCFTPQRRYLGTSEIAQITGLPQPTVWRLCHTLVKLGYLVPTQGREKLRVGVPVLSLGYAAIAELDYVQVVMPHLQALADRFSGVVALAERHRLSMIYVARCDGNSVLKMNLQVGSRVPIYSSAIGWAYLAGVDAEVREKILTQMAHASGSAWPNEKAIIDEALAGYASEGFVINCGVQHPDVGAAAVPVRSADGKSLLAINCAGPLSTFTPAVIRQQIGPSLKSLSSVLRANLRSA